MATPERLKYRTAPRGGAHEHSSIQGTKLATPSTRQSGQDSLAGRSPWVWATRHTIRRAEPCRPCLVKKRGALPEKGAAERAGDSARALRSSRILGLTRALPLRLHEHGRVLRGLVAQVGGELGTQRPWAGELEPETQHVALLVSLGPVYELRPRVEHRVVVHELDVARGQVHVEPQVGSPRLLVEMVERRLLQRGQGYPALHRSRVDLVADVAAAHHLARVAEYGNGPVGDPALGQRRLPADVVEAVVQETQVLGTVREDLVVDGHRAHDAAEPTLEGSAQAEEADHIARVGVIGEIGARLVAAHVDVPVGAAVVVDVAEEIALRILMEGRAHVASEAPEDQADVVVLVALHGEPAEHGEPAAVVQLGHRLLEPGPRDGERELLAADVLQGPAARLGGRQGAVDIGDLVRGPGDEPRRRVTAERVASPGLGTADRLRPDRAHRR